jgi:hypothetical protein
LYHVKPPNEVNETWDYYKTVRVIRAADVYRTAVRGACPSAA